MQQARILLTHQESCIYTLLISYTFARTNQIIEQELEGARTMATQALYRPVGLYEYQKIEANSFKKFPPRFPHQPIFYPVLHREYAVQIARD